MIAEIHNSVDELKNKMDTTNSQIRDSEGRLKISHNLLKSEVGNVWEKN